MPIFASLEKLCVTRLFCLGSGCLTIARLSSLTLTLVNSCNPTTSSAQAFQHASSNDIHSHDE